MDSGSSNRAATLRTATEPRRLQILELIWDRERSVGDIASHLPVSVGAVSQHLAKLRAAGLVSVRRDGRHRFYRASREDMGTLAVVLESFWKDRLHALKRLAESTEADPRDRGTEPEVGRDRGTEPGVGRDRGTESRRGDREPLS